MSSVYAEARTLAKELYARERRVGAFADCAYKHVVEAIDFDAIYRFEQILIGLLGEVGIHDEDGELAETIIRDAIVRAANDPDRDISDVPFGITKAEAAAVAFDPSCPICVLEAARPPESEAPDHVDGECECCDMMARDWRAEHAEALARAGLAPRSPARAAPS
jgi:hypothetical protein